MNYIKYIVSYNFSLDYSNNHFARLYSFSGLVHHGGFSEATASKQMLFRLRWSFTLLCIPLGKKETWEGIREFGWQRKPWFVALIKLSGIGFALWSTRAPISWKVCFLAGLRCIRDVILIRWSISFSSVFI